MCCNHAKSPISDWLGVCRFDFFFGFFVFGCCFFLFLVFFFCFFVFFLVLLSKLSGVNFFSLKLLIGFFLS